MPLRRLGLCLLSVVAGLLVAAGLLALAEVAQAAPLSAPAVLRPYPGAAPCHTTLQACINGANAGDIIQIAAGTFTETFTLSRAVSLAGAGADLTFLHAEPGRRVFSITFTTTPGITISGLTILGGALPVNVIPGGQGGGVYIREHVPAVTFENVVFRHNTARDGGGLYSSYNVSLSLSNTHFLSNTAARVGGGLAALFDVTLTVTNSRFINNVAGSGGGLSAAGDTNLHSTEFISNAALGGLVVPYGGGAHTASGQVIASRFEDNHVSGGSGGGLWTNATLISDTAFLSNTAVFGAGLQANALAALVNVTFTGNLASLWGGGAYFGHGATLTGAVASNNQAADGGAFFFSNLSQQAWLTGAVLSGNTAISPAGTAGIVFGYLRAPTQSVDGLINATLIGAGAPGSRAIQVGLGRALALTGTTIAAHTVGVVNLGPQAAQPTGYYSETLGLGVCGLPEAITYTRPITVWYGSLSAAGAPVLSLASLSDRVDAAVHGRLELAGRPPALLHLLTPWVDTVSNSLEIVLTGDGLDAETNLRTALANAWLPAPYTGVMFAPPIDRGTEPALLAAFSTFVECGEEFQEQSFAYQTRLAFMELNAVAVIQRFLPFVLR